MIQDADLKSKLILQADIFQHHYRKKEYVEAKLTRERAGIVAVFIRLPEKERTELFGDRQGDEPVEGMFDEGKCIKAGFESIKRGFDMQRMTYEDVMALVNKKRG
ncbi:hypothetical protein [Roseburia inulinivorans]|uniref:hypothetical protein n=1 Tax=Roseburia inulinivorans TaxID=360807 RepID=UPI0026721004|nr:hypothetical protein [Roseburia inulinivorans]